MKYIVNPLTAVFYAASNYGIFLLNGAGVAKQKMWTGSSWTDWEDFGSLARPPGAALGALHQSGGGSFVAVQDKRGWLRVGLRGRFGWEWEGYFLPPSATLVGSVAGVSWNALSGMAFYAIGSDGNVWQVYKPAFGNPTWESIGKPPGTLSGAIAAVSWVTGQFAVYVCTAEGRLYQKWWEVSKWREWEEQPQPSGVRMRSISAVWTDNLQYAIYGIGDDGLVWERYWASGWGNWKNMGRPGNTELGDAVASVGWTFSEWGIYVQGKDNSVYQKWVDNHRWSEWKKVADAPPVSDAEISAPADGSNE